MSHAKRILAGRENYAKFTLLGMKGQLHHLKYFINQVTYTGLVIAIDAALESQTEVQQVRMERDKNEP